MNAPNTEETLKKQLTDAIQLYYDRNSINETAALSFYVPGDGRLTINLHTSVLLGYDCLRVINTLVWTFMLTGVMYELVNVVTAPAEIDKNLIPAGAALFIEESGEISPEAFDALKSKSEALPPSKKKK